MKLYVPIVSAALLLSAALGAQPVVKANYAQAERFSQKKTARMVGSTRIRPQWFQDGERFWYSWKAADGTHFYLVNAASGKKQEIFDREKLARQLSEVTLDPYDAQHLGIQPELKDDKRLQWDLETRREKLDSAGNSTGEHVKYRFYYDLASGELSWDCEEHHPEYPDWANVSPDGSAGVYVKNYNLYLMDRENLAKAAKDPKDSTLVEKALTSDGTAEHSWDGDNYTGDMEADTTARHWASVRWAPDGKHIAGIRWDMSEIKKLWVIHSTSSPRPTLESYHYQMPGEKGPAGSLWVMDLEGKCRTYPWESFKDQDGELISAPATAALISAPWRSSVWLGDAKGLWLLRRSRDLKRTDLCRLDLDADSTRTVVAERLNSYVETRDPVLLPSGDLVWWSERNGWANLYLYGADGSLKRNLTEGSFHVEDVLAQGSGYLLVSACGVNPTENPYQMHNYRVALSGGAMKQLDMDDMDVLATASENGKYLVANYSRVDVAPAVCLISAQGKRTELEKADLSRLIEAGYRFPERFKVKAADGVTDLYGVMYKPFDFDSTRVYPLADYVYPGPQVEANNISWSAGFTRTDRLAQLGIIVITVGNRGGHPNRSKWYHNYGYGNLRDYGLEDQKCAIQQLAARHRFIDPKRVGIHGHSGGGFMSTAAILKYPEFFKAAVSCAGNHDNSIYNRWWSEQHHGIREVWEKGDTSFVYSISTNQEIAPALKGRLMLVTGDVDNNVNPANTIRVADALIRAGKRFELVVLPGQRHGFGDMNEYFFWKMADHYSRYLIGDRRERPVDIEEIKND